MHAKSDMPNIRVGFGVVFGVGIARMQKRVTKGAVWVGVVIVIVWVCWLTWKIHAGG
jgi:hypothetical protein